MGIHMAKEKLFHSIDAGNFEDVKFILGKYPQIVNEPFDKKQLGYPILRAA